MRTWWSLRGPEPDPTGEAELLELLTPAESVLYRSMDATDRAHAVACARFVEGDERDVIVASALHDVGKADAGLGTPGRVLATLCGLVIADEARGWTRHRGLRRRIAVYLDHADRGAAALEHAGAPPLAIAWAREHHLPPEAQTITPAIATALHAADDA